MVERFFRSLRAPWGAIRRGSRSGMRPQGRVLRSEPL